MLVLVTYDVNTEISRRSSQAAQSSKSLCRLRPAGAKLRI